MSIWSELDGKPLVFYRLREIIQVSGAFEAAVK
jgi:hypothetical protein